MEYSGLPYPEAIRQLAEQYGIPVPETQRGEKPANPEIPGLTQRMNDALSYYRAELKKSRAAIDYLKGRGLSGEIAARYGLGYAPDGWQNLEAVFPDYATGPLKDTGLVIDSEPEGEKKSRRYDRFRNRVMFPILDARGNVIGFGGRVIGEGEPKYLNSPETPLFEKGRELYGLYQARRAIRDTNQVVVVEGYMDVVALAQHGVENAVATLGTATTPVHVGKLLKMADNVVFCFDGDAAGRKAAWRALEVSLPLLADGKRVGFLFLPSPDDPDDFVRREGKEAFLQALASARPLSQVLFSEIAARVDMETAEGRAAFVAQARPLVSQIQAPALGAMVRKRMAELARLDPEEVAPLLPAAAPPPSLRPQRGAPERRTRKALSNFDQLLGFLLQKPELAGRVPAGLIPVVPESATLREVVHLFAEHGTLSQGQVEAYFRGTDHEAKVVEIGHKALLSEDDGPDIDLGAEVDAIVEALLRQRDKRRQAELLAKLENGEASEAEKAEYSRLFQAMATEKSGNPPTGPRSNF